MRILRFCSALFLLIMLAPSLAAAGACCMSAATFGIGRLKAWEDVVVGTRFTYASTVGNWGADGLWLRNPLRYSESESRAELYAIYRIAERWEVSALLPGLVTVRDIGSEHGVGGGVGDMQASVRWEAISLADYDLVPAVGLTASLVLPTGQRVEQTDAPLDTGATGRGVWGAALALEVEETLGDFWLRLDLGMTYYLPFERSDLNLRQTYGPTLAGALSGGVVFLDVLALGVIASYGYDIPITIDGDVIDDSAAASPTIGLGASWAINNTWSLLANASTAVFASGLGRNRPGRVSAGLGLRYAYY